MESAVTAPVSGHVKRVVVHEGGLMLPSWKSNLFSDADVARRGLNRPRRPRCGNCALTDLVAFFKENDVMRLPVACFLLRCRIRFRSINKWVICVTVYVVFEKRNSGAPEIKI